MHLEKHREMGLSSGRTLETPSLPVPAQGNEHCPNLQTDLISPRSCHPNVLRQTIMKSLTKAGSKLAMLRQMSFESIRSWHLRTWQPPRGSLAPPPHLAGNKASSQARQLRHANVPKKGLRSNNPKKWSTLFSHCLLGFVSLLSLLSQRDCAKPVLVHDVGGSSQQSWDLPVTLRLPVSWSAMQGNPIEAHENVAHQRRKGMKTQERDLGDVVDAVFAFSLFPSHSDGRLGMLRRCWTQL
jgi:hypothetical protein